MITLAGCSRTEPQEQPRPGRPAASPRETLARLLEARDKGAYQDIRPLVVPEHAENVISTLMAVDDFLLANRELCEFVREHVGIGLAQSIDQSHLGAYLEIFSSYVELLAENIEGQQAQVSFLIDGELPVKRAELKLIGGTWHYDPGPGYTPEIPQAFLRMARGLRQTLQEIKSGRLSAEALRDDPELLANEVRLRLLPGAKMLPQLGQAEQNGD
jgi:hypothetical protein